ncbi:uncharacterized protein A1O9_11796 [Exophiala aquamarina CBS 119918]|uniref:Apoptosis regulator Bcl-2 family BH4 domain-containing protein n=1 Tax=Exophiala aquamarina CBS 119918 TaxID=1182545 RepID=A0A072NWA8_9EURO|nr:uncharacterized protein A1O9_11796 [Exophiala aquamarina CBS 119918]KEF52169.1 hypothetical protein A1O9_11796 [Exophiala aquamarina CBS 119918]
MFSSLLPRSLPTFGLGRGGTGESIQIPAVEVHDVEVLSDKRGRRLKHLLRLNHATYSILYNRLRFHNHTPHHLGSGYLLGGTADHLNDIYEDAVANDGHEPWKDSPSEIALHDYRDYLGKREYQRAWVDFFEDQLVLEGYEWKDVVGRFIYERGSKGSANEWPLFNALVSGLGHPLIHLGYAYELNSREVAMEALGLAATCYDPKLAGMLEHSPSSQSNSTNDLYEVFERVHSDKRLDGAFDKYGGDNLSRLLADEALTTILLEHWSSWKIADPTRDFAQSQQLATNLLIASGPAVGGHGYDFFLVHLLTTSHAVRILIPFIPREHHVKIVREWLWITIAIYIAQLRPAIKKSSVTNFDLRGRDWAFAKHTALEGKKKLDAHFVKAIRAIKEVHKLWGDPEDAENFFLKAAVRLASEFDGWGGFGAEDEEAERDMEEEIKKRRAQ